MKTFGAERGSFGALLLAQLVFIFLTPFASRSGEGRLFLYLGVFGILAAGLWAASRDRRQRRIAIAILCPVLFAWLGPDLFSEDVEQALVFLTPAFSYAFTIFVVTREVFRHEQVKLDTILGAIDVYLLLCFAFLFLHLAVVVVAADAYSIGGRPLADELLDSPGSQGFSTMIYFSFTTLTTLGYGDIVPVRPFARLLTSAEAVVGQLYVAIIIGRLVGLEVSARSASQTRSA